MPDIKPTTHLEKSIAGIVEPVTHLERVIAEYGGGSGGGEGTKNYNQLVNRPKINGVTLSGDLKSADLGIEQYDDTALVDRISSIEEELEGLTPGGAVSSVNGKTGAVKLTAADVGAAEAETAVEVSGTTPTIEPQANTIYNCGEVASLTISNPPATGTYSITFTSGSTPTDLSLDPAIKMPDGFSVEANKRYEINVLNRWAVAGSWAVSA